jgi:type IX secretion system PorP/SprF family membrane protein
MRQFFIITSLLICAFCNAQELPVYNEYLLNKSLINPAIIGSEPCTWIKATDRHQWIGIKDAPNIQTLSFETSLYNKKAIRETDKKIHGIGAYIYHDKNGAYNTLGGQVSYAYHFYLSKAKSIKMGLGVAFRIYESSLDESGLHGDFDPIITGSVTRVIQPDAGGGVFIYNQKFYAGLSFTQLLSSPNMTLNNMNPVQHFFLMAGFLTGSEKDHIRILPSAVIKMNTNADKQIDLNAKVLFGETWWTGLSLRHNLNLMPGKPTAIVPMIGVNIGEISIGYALELTPSQMVKYNYGTHEFSLSYRLCRDGFRCPVYR